MIFTKEQLAHWKRYERVRRGGRWNMFDPAARNATGLDRDEYLFVMKNYEALEEQATQPKKEQA